MEAVHNPFITRGYIPAECFCDRGSETQVLAKSLMNGNDVVLFSPRSMGKTGQPAFGISLGDIQLSTLPSANS